jgi:hypothetical protein
VYICSRSARRGDEDVATFDCANAQTLRSLKQTDRRAFQDSSFDSSMNLSNKHTAVWIFSTLSAPTPSLLIVLPAALPVYDHILTSTEPTNDPLPSPATEVQPTTSAVVTAPFEKSLIAIMAPPHLPHLKSKTSSSSSKLNMTWRESLRSTRKEILNTIGYNSSSGATEIPPDNIFVPIQQDNILPQIPIGRHHPVPRKGIEDDDKRTLHTNSFYANAFLGDQNQPIWTHPYRVWWGKRWEESGLVKTWGMCLSHIEESDLVFGEGDPASVSLNVFTSMMCD